MDILINTLFVLQGVNPLLKCDNVFPIKSFNFGDIKRYFLSPSPPPTHMTWPQGPCKKGEQLVQIEIQYDPQSLEQVINRSLQVVSFCFCQRLTDARWRRAQDCRQ